MVILHYHRFFFPVSEPVQDHSGDADHLPENAIPAILTTSWDKRAAVPAMVTTGFVIVCFAVFPKRLHTRWLDKRST